VVRIAISAEAFEAIAQTLPLGSVSYENASNEKGERYVWLDTKVVNHLRTLRGPGETLSCGWWRKASRAVQIRFHWCAANFRTKAIRFLI
jgi:hypothetical protein